MSSRDTHEPSAVAGGSFCIIGLAHGSRHPQTAGTIASLMSRVGEQLGVTARAAFLDLTAPDLDTVANELAAAGAQQAVVVPLLFTQAFHATVDVPDAVRDAAASSGLDLRLADILGTGDDVLEVLERSAEAAAIEADAAVLLFAVGSSRPEANAAVEDLASRLGERRGTDARAGFGTVDPRAAAAVNELGEPVAIVPLFLAPGLLLDPMARTAAERGWVMAPHLGDLAAGIVVERYRARLDADQVSATVV